MFLLELISMYGNVLLFSQKQMHTGIRNSSHASNTSKKFRKVAVIIDAFHDIPRFLGDFCKTFQGDVKISFDLTLTAKVAY